jgi:hypothetical protein
MRSNDFFFEMAHQKKLSEVEIVDLLDVVEDDDDLSSLSVDEDVEDIESDGPEESEEVIFLDHPSLDTQRPPPSPGSQDLFTESPTFSMPLSPQTQRLVDNLSSPAASPSVDELPSPGREPPASPGREPPAKRRRIQIRQKPGSGKCVDLYL